MKNIRLLPLVLLGVLISCTPSEKKEEINQEDIVIHDIDKLLEDLPDPSAVPLTLKSINAPYTDSIINSLDNISSYQGNYDKMAMNMGVYAADVSYLACYNQRDLTMDYVRSCHKLGEILGDSAIFDNTLLNEIEASLENEKALSALLRKMIVQTSIQLEKDHHLSMAALALTGSFVEELYHAVNIIENYHGQGMSEAQNKKVVEPLVKLVLAQEQPLLDLIQLLDDIPSDETIIRVETKLKTLEALYQGELAEIRAKLDADPGFIIDRDLMYGITLEIERIREDIVK